MSHNYNGLNGDWRGSNRSDVLFSDEEVWMLSQIDAAEQPGAMWVGSIAEQEMRCQRDMTVRGKRLWNYHQRLGDLNEILFGFMTNVLGATSCSADMEFSVALTEYDQ